MLGGVVVWMQMSDILLKVDICKWSEKQIVGNKWRTWHQDLNWKYKRRQYFDKRDYYKQKKVTGWTFCLSHGPMRFLHSHWSNFGNVSKASQVKSKTISLMTKAFSLSSFREINQSAHIVIGWTVIKSHSYEFTGFQTSYAGIPSELQGSVLAGVLLWFFFLPLNDSTWRFVWNVNLVSASVWAQVSANMWISLPH